MGLEPLNSSPRDRLLTAVTSLLDEMDASAVTITDVAARAGVSRPTFYATFADLPDAFGEAAVVRLAEALGAEVLVDVSSLERPVAMLASITRVLERVQPHTEFFTRVFQGHGGTLVQSRIVALLTDEFRSNTPLSAALARGPLDIEVSARAVATVVAATMLDWFSQPSPSSIDEQALLIRDLVLHMVIGGLGVDTSDTTSEEPQ